MGKSPESPKMHSSQGKHTPERSMDSKRKGSLLHGPSKTPFKKSEKFSPELSPSNTKYPNKRTPKSMVPDLPPVPLKHSPSDVDSEHSIPTEPDPYTELLYAEPSAFLPQAENTEKMHTVLVQKPLPFKETVSLQPRPSIELPIDPVGESGLLTVYDEADSMTSRQCGALEAQVITRVCSAKRRARALATQESCLQRWSSAKRELLANNRAIADRVGGLPEGAMLNRAPPLPPLQDHQAVSAGHFEDDFPCSMQKERFYQGVGFHTLPFRFGSEEEPLITQMTWTEREFYKPPFSIVRPQLRELGKAFPLKGVKPTKQRHLEALYVEGEALRPPEYVEEETSLEVSQEVSIRALLKWSRERPFIRKYKQEYSVIDDSMLGLPYSVPALQLDRFIFIWKLPCLMEPVELGLACEPGERSVFDIRLVNRGICPIRYSWQHHPHHDTFNTARFYRSCFIFHNSNGIILPEEKVILPVQFKSDIAGSWTERWTLHTTPKVGQDGQIQVNLFGQAVDSDAHMHARERLMEDIHDGVVRRISTEAVHSLVNCIPIRDHASQVVAALSPSDLLRHECVRDFERFILQHPGTHYHSSEMLQLQRVNAHLQIHNQQKVRSNEAMGKETEVGDYPLTGKSNSLISNIDSGGRKRKISGLVAGEKSAAERKHKSRSPSDPSVQGTYRAHRDKEMGNRHKNTASKMKRVSNSQTDVKLSRANKCVESLEELTKTEAAALMKLPRGELSVLGLYKEALAMEEGAHKCQEKLLRMVNQVMTMMTHSPPSPSMRHWKLVMVRSLLLQVMDAISDEELAIREALELDTDPLFKALANFPTQVKSRVPSGRVTSGKGEERAAKALFRVEIAKTIDWDQPEARAYHKALSIAVYMQLEAALLDMLALPFTLPLAASSCNLHMI